MGSRNPLKIYKNPSLHPKMSFLVLPGAPGSSHGPPSCPIGNTRHAYLKPFRIPGHHTRDEGPKKEVYRVKNTAKQISVVLFVLGVLMYSLIFLWVLDVPQMAN